MALRFLVQEFESGGTSHYTGKRKVGVGVKRAKPGVVIRPQRWPRTGVQGVDSRTELYS